MENIEDQEVDDVIKKLGGLKELTRSSLLKYQKEFYEDDSRMVLWAKSRQIGGTWTASYKVMQDASRSKFAYTTYWISKDENLAREFILYCLCWVRCYNAISRYVADVEVIRMDKDCLALQIRLPNGCRVVGLSSKASAAVGLHGTIWIDELAVHDNQEALYRYTMPCTQWGYNFYVISTTRGEDTIFEKLRNDKTFGFSVHVTTIEDAVKDGIVDKINETAVRMGNKKETPEEFLKKIRDKCISEDDYLQEYMCIPRGNRDAWLQFPWIKRAHTPDAELSQVRGGSLYMGADIGKVRDPSYFFVLEEFARIFWTRYIWRGKLETLSAINAQFTMVYEMFDIAHACIDANGVGESVAETQVEKYGEHKITGLIPTNAINAHIASLMYEKFGRFMMRTPADDQLDRDLYAVKETISDAGVKKYQAPSKWNKGHADGFWSCGYALIAAETDEGPAGAARVEKPEETPFNPDLDLDEIGEELEKEGAIDMLDLK